MTEATASEPFEPTEGNFGMAVAAGLVAALIGALIWAVVVYVTNYQLGIVAIAVGALVGLAVQMFGRGSDQKFAIVGAACAALSWVLGTVLCDVALLAKGAGVGFGEALGRLGGAGTVSLVKETSSAMDLLFLAIAVWEGYKFAIRRH